MEIIQAERGFSCSTQGFCVLQEPRDERCATVLVTIEGERKVVHKIFVSDSYQDDPNPEKKVYDVLSQFSHENICEFVRFDRRNREQILVLGYMPFDLSKVRLESHQIPKAFQDIVKGLAFLHKQGFIHGDLKPQNVLYDGKTAKIADFGLTIYCGEGKVLGNHEIITLPYRPPELVLSQYTVFGTEVDIWSLGVVFVEMFLGKQFFTNSKKKIMEEHSFHRFRPKKIGGMDDGARFLMNWMLSFDPNVRPTAGQILADDWFVN